MPPTRFPPRQPQVPQRDPLLATLSLGPVIRKEKRVPINTAAHSMPRPNRDNHPMACLLCVRDSMWEMETARWLGEGGMLSLPQWIEEERRKHRAVKLPTQHPTAYGKAQRWLLTPRETGAGGGAAHPSPHSRHLLRGPAHHGLQTLHCIRSRTHEVLSPTSFPRTHPGHFLPTSGPHLHAFTCTCPHGSPFPLAATVQS